MKTNHLTTAIRWPSRHNYSIWDLGLAVPICSRNQTSLASHSQNHSISDAISVTLTASGVWQQQGLQAHPHAATTFQSTPWGSMLPALSLPMTTAGPTKCNRTSSCSYHAKWLEQIQYTDVYSIHSLYTPLREPNHSLAYQTRGTVVQWSCFNGINSSVILCNFVWEIAEK